MRIVESPETEPFESIACPLCGGNDHCLRFVANDRLLGREGEFPIVTCAVCELVFVSPRPAGAALARYYPDTYYPLHEKPTREAQSVADGLVRVVDAWVQRRGISQPRVLDIGCGTGLFLHRARERGMQVTGIELSESAVAYARTVFGLDVRAGSLESLSLPDAAYDVITMWHVIEHLPDPVESLRRVRQALAPGGLLLLAMPNIASIEARIFGRRWYSLDAPRHLVHFSPATIAHALERAEFTVEYIRHSSGTAGLVYSVMGDLTGISLKTRGRPLSEPAYRRIAGILHLLFRPVCWAFARIGRGGALEVFATRS